jgi:RNA polymerase sigma-70 factor (ECF subfamily)
MRKENGLQIEFLPPKWDAYAYLLVAGYFSNCDGIEAPDAPTYSIVELSVSNNRTEDGNQGRPGPLNYSGFMELYSAHSRRIYGFISMLLSSSGDVEDVFQETSKVLWEKFDQFKIGTNFYAWASNVARYQVLAHLQHCKRSRLVFSTEFIHAVSDEALGHEETLEDKHRALQDCLKKLKTRDLNLIELRYTPGATTKSVAQHVGRSVAGIYKALNRIESALIKCVHFKLS